VQFFSIGITNLVFLHTSFFLWKKNLHFSISDFEDCIADEVAGVKFIKLLGELQEPE
jgi:hypothetical protein